MVQFGRLRDSRNNSRGNEQLKNKLKIKKHSRDGVLY